MRIFSLFRRTMARMIIFPNSIVDENSLSLQKSQKSMKEMRQRRQIHQISFGIAIIFAILFLRTFFRSSKGSEIAENSGDSPTESFQRLRRSILDYDTSKSENFLFGDETSTLISKLRQSLPSTNEVFISVKTTKKYHSSRLQTILDTWYRLAPELVRTSK